jgi:hypothetical protein
MIDLLAQAGRELDVLSGRSFRPARRTTSVFEPNGLPFVDIPDLLVGSMEPVAGAWEVPDPVNRQMAVVLQVVSLADPVPNAVSVAEALWFPGQLAAEASKAGRLSRDYVLYWLGASGDREQQMELMHRVMDPAVRLSVPILGVPVGGWWIQIARRLMWVTSETEDEGRLIELLLDKAVTGGEAAPLAATEPSPPTPAIARTDHPAVRAADDRAVRHVPTPSGGYRVRTIPSVTTRDRNGPHGQSMMPRPCRPR